jgi:colicin import membrane protein
MYYAHAHTTSQEKVISGAVASAMHVMFIALLFFGVNWQKKAEPQVNIVDLWSPPAQVEPQAVEPPAPEPPKAEVKPVPPTVDPTPPKPVAKPEVAKPDIALKEKEKEKIEKERRAVEDKQKETKKREDAAQAAQKAQAAEAQRLANEQADAQRALASQAAAAQAKLRSEYLGRIRDKIKRFIVKPANLQGNEETDFDVVLLPDGNVLGVKLKRPSGNAAYDNAVERAISRAQPLPVPQDPALLKDFRELNLKFKAQE